MTDVGKALTEHQEEQDAALDDLEEDGEGMDKRHPQRRWDREVEKEGELSDSEDEEMADSLGVRRANGASRKRRRSEKNYGFGNAHSVTGSGIGTPVMAGSEAPSEAGDRATNVANERALGVLGYTGEHDDELEALSKEDQEEKNDGDGDIEMEDELPASREGDKPTSMGMDGADDEDMADPDAAGKEAEKNTEEEQSNGAKVPAKNTNISAPLAEETASAQPKTTAESTDTGHPDTLSSTDAKAETNPGPSVDIGGIEEPKPSEDAKGESGDAAADKRTES